LLEEYEKCPESNRHLHKADYFALAKTLGLDFVEIENYERGYHISDEGNPIHTSEIDVDAKVVADKLLSSIESAKREKIGR